MSGSEKKVNRSTYNISSIKRVTRKFLEVSRCSRAKQRQRNVQKSVQSCFLLIRKKCAAGAKFFFGSDLDLLIFLAVFVAFAAWRYMILYFV